MKSGKAFFILGWLIIVSIAIISCPIDDPVMELIIPPDPIEQIEGAPSGKEIVTKPGYSKYWALGGYVQVDMTVEDGYITEVYIDFEHEDRFLCKEIIERWGYHEDFGPGWMVERNTVELDVISGATYTSIAVLEAAAEALNCIVNNKKPQDSMQDLTPEFTSPMYREARRILLVNLSSI